MTSLGFIIAACLREETHYKSLCECIASIYALYDTIKIAVVIDFTSDRDLIRKVHDLYSDVIYEIDTPHVPADMLLLYYFKQKHYFDIAVTLQDSMRLVKKIEVSASTDIKYLWHFTNHRLQWSTIREPQTDFTRQHMIDVHDDLNNYVITNLLKNTAFREYCETTYYNKQSWSGCFGCCCIMSHTFVETLDVETNIIDLMFNMNNNRLRRSIESMFALACQFATKHEIHDSFDGLYFDGVSGNNMIGTHIVKKSFNRK